MQWPKFTTREVIASVTFTAIGIACVRAFLLFVRSLSVEGADATGDVQVGAYVLTYFFGGLCLGLAIGILLHRPILWAILGVIGALFFVCDGVIFADGGVR